MVKGVVDTVFVFRFVRMLVMRWEDMDAYEFGIIDNNGKPLKKAKDLKSTPERNSYTPFVRLVFNIKRLLEKLPFGKTKLGSFAAALWLIKEQSDLNNATVEALLDEMDVAFDLSEDTQWFVVNDTIPNGNYNLTEEIVSGITGEVIGRKGDTVSINNPDYVDQFMGVNIYECRVNNQTTYITQWQISK